MGEVSRRLNAGDIDLADAPVTPTHLGALIARIADNTVSNSAARQVFDALWSR
jgi:aspartyl-tRNA(Asn)/glutamyl-tRNA(Gln) amidotransferase subunit B